MKTIKSVNDISMHDMDEIDLDKQLPSYMNQLHDYKTTHYFL